MWLGLWLQGGQTVERVGEQVLYDATSQWEVRLFEFISPDGKWRWSQVSIVDLWDRVQVVCPCVIVRDQWVWVSGRQGGFSIESAWIFFVFVVTGFIGRVCCGEGEYF